MHRDVDRLRRGSRGLEVHDPDPAVRVALHPVGGPGELHPVRAELDLALGTGHLGPEQLLLGRAPARQRTARWRPPPPPARWPTASWRRSQLVPDDLEMRSQRSSGSARRPAHRAGRARARPNRRSPQSAGRIGLALAGEEPLPRTTQQYGELAAGQGDGRLRRGDLRRGVRGSRIPHQWTGSAVGTSGRPSARPTSANLANRLAAWSRRAGGVSASTVTVRRRSATSADSDSGRRGRPATASTGTSSSLRKRDGWSPSPSVPATAVTTSRRRARVHAT